MQDKLAALEGGIKTEKGEDVPIYDDLGDYKPRRDDVKREGDRRRAGDGDYRRDDYRKEDDRCRDLTSTTIGIVASVMIVMRRRIGAVSRRRSVPGGGVILTGRSRRGSRTSR